MRLSALARAALGPRIVIALLSAVFLAINIFTADRSPTVWIDEILFTDPGANLAAGRGFRSTTSAYQDGQDLYAANAPLHPLLISGWVTVFGFTVTGVRSLNYALTVLLLILLWEGGRRHGLVSGTRGAVLLTLLIYGGYAITFSYRSGRYDMLGAVIGAAILCAATLQPPWRIATTVGLAALLPWTGLQLIPLALATGMVAVTCLGRRVLGLFAAIAGGIALGSGLLLGHFAAHGVLDDFVRSVTGMSDAASGIGPRMSAVLTGLRTDVSSGLLLLVLLLLAVEDALGRRFSRAAPVCAGLAFAVAVPLLVGLSGRWMGYYSWMKFVPMSVCVVAALTAPGVTRSRWVVASATALLLVASSGLAARMAVVAVEWQARDYAPVEAFVRRNLVPADVAYCDFQAYYEARRQAREIYLPPHLAALDATHRAAVTVLVIDPSRLEEIQASLGGRWTLRDQYQAPHNVAFPGAALARWLAHEGGAFGAYTLAVYRRTAD